ncbi:MAG: CRTAC1 family protein, partial [Planctomycetaceae bacterium]|nr:CRTAC1 family protein [Planctomycetaceae bacterium]
DNFADAMPAFAELATALPNDPPGPRNLVVARLQALKIGQTNPDDLAAAVDQMLAREPQSSAASWLAARAAVSAAELLPDGPERNALRQTAVARFDKALTLSPDVAAIHYELFDALRYSTSADDLVRAHRALREAHRLAPENLFVLADWLAVQAEQKDAEIAGSLAGLSQLVAPLREGIRTRSRVDVQTLIDDATKAVAAGTWPLATGKVRALGSVLRPEEQAQSDRRRIAPHPLEFVLHDFQAATCPAVGASAVNPTVPSFVHSEVAWPLDGLGELRGLTTVDFNLDGRLDIIVVGSESLVALQQTDGQAWEAAARLPLTSAYTGLVAVDFDRDAVETAGPRPAEICQDADPDVLAYGPGGVLLLKNELDAAGQRTLVNAITDQPLGEVRDVLAAIPADFDHDGDLDVVLSTPAGIQLWAQQGAWRFVDVSARSQLPPDGPPVTTIVAVDLDRDIDLDLVLGGPERPVGYLENLRHGELRYRELPVETKFANAASLAVIEADGNVSWDLVAAGPRGVSVLLTDTPGRGQIAYRTASSILTAGVQGAIAADVNNDAVMDLVAWSPMGVTIHLGRGDGKFSAASGIGVGRTTSIAAGDIDADGDLDLLIAAERTPPMLYRNESDTKPGWLSVRVRGAEDPQSGRVNQYGVGSLVEVRTGGRYQAQVITGQATHFGLGTQMQADSLRVVWTNGVPQVVLSPQPNQAVCERLTLKGSCPYLYTWTGGRFEFFTDLLWNAPVGLQFADGVLAPSRAWEYLLVPGDACRPRDGQYVLQITEELWETAYFDEIELIAVDHPADVEVFSNEKVGPPDIAEMKAHTVRQRRTPVAARDQRGRDVLDQVRDIDGVYLKACDRELRQGLTEPHYLELDLGPLDSPRQITLFLTGWIYPTDVSLNIALDHDPELSGPKPPSLWTPDATGEFREVRPFIGFPGGKTKTIAIDLTNTFTGSDYRLRIPTTHEIYWDSAFFTVDEPPADVRMTPLKLLSADVHPRGFSQPNLPQPNAPETYDYSQVSTSLKWPPMAGRFTRYGDVRELLQSTDDRLLVMASGDEVTVTFAPPAAELPPGWRRDFFLHNVGWDKDADLHTVYGQTVEPLPYVAMPGYPYPPDQGPADTAAYRDYLRIYQTRETPHGAFWRAHHR